MITIGVTGGLGSGKSSVVRLLGERGAEVADADQIARDALLPGSASFASVVDRFGSEILDPGGTIDRAALGRLVFSDPTARADLERIVHPVVRSVILERVDALEGRDAVLVLDIPLLVETGGRERYRLDGVLVVDAPIDLAVERVARDRGLDPLDARARIAAQADPGERLRAADFIIMNHGTPDELALMTDGAWRWIETVRATKQTA